MTKKVKQVSYFSTISIDYNLQLNKSVHISIDIIFLLCYTLDITIKEQKCQEEEVVKKVH